MRRSRSAWRFSIRSKTRKVIGKSARSRRWSARSGPSVGAKWGGETAIATYALCAAGELQSENVKKAIEWLENADLHGTYAVGLRSQVWSFIPAAAQEQGQIIRSGAEAGRQFCFAQPDSAWFAQGIYGYGYGKDAGGSLGAAKFGTLDPKGPPEGAWYDRSNSQYGVLGAWALEQAGAEIPTSFWLEEDDAWKKAQTSMADGTTADSRRTVTPLHHDLRRPGHALHHPGLRDARQRPSVRRLQGRRHQHKHRKGPGVDGQAHHRGRSGRRRITYGLYGIERIGVASGRKYFGTVDWYKLGAEPIVKRQAAGGSWGALHDTCFCLCSSAAAARRS